jgi:hypothetical protein
MKRTTFFNAAALLLLLAGCQKSVDILPPPPVVPPQMQSFTLGERVVRYGSAAAPVDPNGDGTTDLLFSVWPVGDPIEKLDKRQFRVTSTLYTSLPVMTNEQVKVLSKAAIIPVDDSQDSPWYNASSIILAERREDLSGNISWNGNWLQASHHFLPFQVLKNSHRYNGWIEISMDQVTEQIVLHRGAISLEPEKDIRAGY